MSSIPRNKRRYLKKTCDRSGFDYFKNELVWDNGWWVYPSEKDDPPPHPRYIGGEGDRNLGESRSVADRTSVPETKTEIYNP